MKQDENMTDTPMEGAVSDDHNKPLAFIYKCWQPEMRFQVTVDVSSRVEIERGVAVAIVPLNSREQRSENVFGDWNYSKILKSNFQYLPLSKGQQFVGLPTISFDAPVYGLEITFHPWKRNTASLRETIKRVLIAQEYAQEPMDLTAPKLGRYAGLAQRKDP